MDTSSSPGFGASPIAGGSWSAAASTHGFDHGPAGGGGSGGGGSGGGQGGSGGGGGDGQGGGGQGGGPLPRGCLFGGWRAMHIDDDLARNRPPLPGVAALGLMVVVVALLALWFIAR